MLPRLGSRVPLHLNSNSLFTSTTIFLLSFIHAHTHTHTHTHGLMQTLLLSRSTNAALSLIASSHSLPLLRETEPTKTSAFVGPRGSMDCLSFPSIISH
ncbi:unnamed protein product [Protopolystoma xenopodis]|uniref:Uncharacterized protein n=1 Tax=Protopolystoma xenopodis TaxID=117903 RepID=A0A448XNV4_9PLAT|nr:unnamed protein product [Protopolystoma xenopodis]